MGARFNWCVRERRPGCLVFGCGRRSAPNPRSAQGRYSVPVPKAHELGTKTAVKGTLAGALMVPPIRPQRVAATHLTMGTQNRLSVYNGVFLEGAPGSCGHDITKNPFPSGSCGVIGVSCSDGRGGMQQDSSLLSRSPLRWAGAYLSIRGAIGSRFWPGVADVGFGVGGVARSMNMPVESR